MTTTKNARRTGAVVAAAGLLVSLAAAPATAGPASKGDPALDFSFRFSKYVEGLSCAAVPTTDGTTLAAAALVTSDSSRRVATVRYSIFGGILGPGYPLGEGKVMVLKGTQSLEGVVSQAERPGPPPAKRDTCSYGVPGATGQAELVHLEPVTLPTRAEVLAWCSTQPWYEAFPGSCPSVGL